MSTTLSSPNLELLQEQENADNKVFGFWIYLMTDAIIFGTFFAVFVVLLKNTTHGHTPQSLFDLSNAFIETVALLTSSLTCGFAMLTLKQGRIKQTILLLILTFILGGIFLALEIKEFLSFIEIGATPQSSGFLSGFFSLVGLHGVHLSIGMIWMIVMMLQLATKGATLAVTTRLKLFSLFWHFLDIIWICIFSVVYLMGVSL
ncbi:cytochrome o ubiquinol oxidase subunit III [Ignatzschineria rhizosphaerae]|uniref:Cytochrome bo(3) ubiquinol oxidase subunit 3 n=1 Tax=Ignatzschineria rhizosphaerae TaxID=2923279 RepID=A0ABY3WXV9_9GAMM|nr:cytochrome o ubiquinol oxidase subunit III [Ignatzschineria rhizosphaerae]UNM95444.1 cytochrome o ubiquinol oxidase subunit III [Ignatzschineria rhizosphaerae]